MVLPKIPHTVYFDSPGIACMTHRLNPKPVHRVDTTSGLI